MKSKTIFTILLIFTTLAFSVKTEAKTNSTLQNDTDTYIKIWVDGMACPFCAYGLEKKIKKLDGVNAIFIEINEGFISFMVSNAKKPSQEMLEKIVKEAGFSARKIEFSKTHFVEKNE